MDNVSSKNLHEASNNDLNKAGGVLIASPMSDAQNTTFHNRSRKLVQQNIQRIRMSAKSVGKIRRQHQLLCDTVIKKRRNPPNGEQSPNYQGMSNQHYDLQNRGPMSFAAASPLDMINLQIMNFDGDSHGGDDDKTRAALSSQ